MAMLQKKVKVKIEDDQDATPMDVDMSDMSMMDNDELQMRMRATKKKMRRMNEDKDELMVDLARKDDRIRALQQAIKEKDVALGSTDDFAQKQDRAIDHAVQDRDHALLERDQARQERDATLVDLDNMTQKYDNRGTELAVLEEKYETIRDKYDKLRDEHQVQKDNLATAARQVAAMQERQRRDRDLFQGPAPSAPAPPAVPPAVEDELQKLRREKEDWKNSKILMEREIMRSVKQIAEAKAPPVVYYTRGGQCYHEASCNHLKHGREDRPRAELRKCSDCMR